MSLPSGSYLNGSYTEISELQLQWLLFTGKKSLWGEPGNKAKGCEGCSVEGDSGHSPFCATQMKETMLYKGKVWVNNNCLCTDIIIIFIQITRSLLITFCRFTIQMLKLHFASLMSQTQCTSLSLHLQLVLMLWFYSLHHHFHCV